MMLLMIWAVWLMMLLLMIELVGWWCCWWWLSGLVDDAADDWVGWLMMLLIIELVGWWCCWWLSWLVDEDADDWVGWFMWLMLLMSMVELVGWRWVGWLMIELVGWWAGTADEEAGCQCLPLLLRAAAPLPSQRHPATSSRRHRWGYSSFRLQQESPIWEVWVWFLLRRGFPFLVPEAPLPVPSLRYSLKKILNRLIRYLILGSFNDFIAYTVDAGTQVYVDNYWRYIWQIGWLRSCQQIFTSVNNKKVRTNHSSKIFF